MREVGSVPAVTAFARATCPYCFNRFHIGDCEIISSSSGEVLRRSARGVGRLFGRLFPPSVHGPEYTQAMAVRRCPHCGEGLPPNVEYVQGRIVGLVGGGSSGKSHYIAALVNLLERQAALAGVGCSYFAAASQEIEKRYEEEYYTPLFRRQEVIPPTKPLLGGQLNKPLIYEIVFEGKQGAPEGRKGVHLVLFDAAGEQIADQASAVVVNRYIQNASALILLVDPMHMPAVVENLPAKYRPSSPPPPHEAFQVLNNVARIYRQAWGLRPDELIKMPLAITLAKSDLLTYAPLGSGQERFRFEENPQYRDGYDPSEFQAASEEVEEILSRLAEPALLQAAGAFADVSFHAVSATGEPPDPSTLTYSSVRSVRCLDPLLWILWRLGMVEGKSR